MRIVINCTKGLLVTGASSQYEIILQDSVFYNELLVCVYQFMLVNDVIVCSFIIEAMQIIILQLILMRYKRSIPIACSNLSIISWESTVVLPSFNNIPFVSQEIIIMVF